MSSVLRVLVEPGFLANGPVRTALVTGTVVAVVSGVIGVLTVVRGQSFAGHALSDISATGGSGALLVGAAPIVGFVGIGVVAAGAMELIGLRRPRARDLATGVVLGASLGLAALFLYLDSTASTSTGVSATVLFGSPFAISAATVPAVVVLGAASLSLVLAVWRPLLLATLSDDLARARGVRVRAVGAAYLLALSFGVSMAALMIGALLGTALLIGPAAAAVRLARRPLAAAGVAAAIGLGATWAGVLLAYDSFYWPPAGRGWPVSFFIVALVFIVYLVADRWSSARSRRPSRG